MGTRHLEPRRGHDAAEKPASAASGILRRGDAADPSNVTASAGLAREPLPPVDEGAAAEPPLSWVERIGWAVLASLLFGLLLGAFAFDRTGRPSLIGDEATYAMQAASLAWDFDLAYSRRDYDRFVAQWGAPPDGVILQSGDGGAHITYGKPFLYALVVAPFARLSPQRGPLVANVLMLAAAAVLTARTLRRRTGELAPLAVAVLVFASVSFAYVYWVHADIFLFAATAAGFALVYGSDRSAPPPGRALPDVYVAAAAEVRWRWLARWFLAGLLLAVPGAFRPFYLALLAPAVLAMPGGDPRRRLRGWGALLGGALALLLVTAVVQHAAGGGWSGYTGQRLGFYARTGYPDVDFPAASWDEVLRHWGNTSWVQEGAFTPSHSPRLWAWNVLYFLLGRDIGVLPYFLPLLLAAFTFRRDRGRWAIPLAVALAAVCFLLVRPFNFYGGGGAIGNRYFLPLYPALWFLAARRWQPASLVLTVAAAAPFLWPLWQHPAAFPIGEDGRYRHVSDVARHLLPYETTQSHVPGGQDTTEHGLWIKLLSHNFWRETTRHGPGPLRMVANGEGELLVGSPTPLRYLAVEMDRQAPARLLANGADLRPLVLRPDGSEVFEVPLLQPRAVHPMWWTTDDVYLYSLRLSLPGARAVPISFDIQRGENPSNFDSQPLPGEGGASENSP